MQETLLLKFVHLIVSTGNLIIILINCQQKSQNSMSKMFLFKCILIVNVMVTVTISISFILLTIDIILYKRLIDQIKDDAKQNQKYFTHTIYNTLNSLVCLFRILSVILYTSQYNDNQSFPIEMTLQLYSFNKYEIMSNSMSQKINLSIKIMYSISPFLLIIFEKYETLRIFQNFLLVTSINIFLLKTKQISPFSSLPKLNEEFKINLIVEPASKSLSTLKLNTKQVKGISTSFNSPRYDQIVHQYLSQTVNPQRMHRSKTIDQKKNKRNSKTEIKTNLATNPLASQRPILQTPSYVLNSDHFDFGLCLLSSDCKIFYSNKAFADMFSLSDLRQQEDFYRLVKINQIDKKSQNDLKLYLKDMKQSLDKPITSRNLSQQASLVDLKSDRTSTDFREILKSYQAHIEHYVMKPSWPKINIIDFSYEGENLETTQKYLGLISYNPKLEKEFKKRYQGIGCSLFLVQFFNTEDKNKYVEKISTQILMKQLFRSFSHEFSTSLNGIQSIAQAAEDSLAEEYDIINNYIKPIINSCSIMNSIVQDIRDFSMLQQKLFILKVEQTDISYLISSCVNLFAEQFKMRNIEYVYTSNLPEPIKISTDCSRLRQIIVNLLSNSQKHTHNGKIEIKIEQDTLNFRVGYYKITVTDEGSGMSLEDIDSLNQILEGSFNNIASKDRERNKNFGLGLMISNQVAQQLSKLKRKVGGGIYFESQVIGSFIKYQIQLKKGSQFWFLIKDHQQQAEEASMQQSYKKAPMIRIDKNTIIFQSQNQHDQGRQDCRISNESLMSPKQMLRQKSSVNKGYSNNFGLDRKFLTTFNASENHTPYFTSHRKVDSESSSIIDILDSNERDLGDQSQIILPSCLHIIHPEDQIIPKYKCSCQKIIVVDDEYINVFALKMLLKNLGFSIDFAYDGLEGYQKVIQRQQNPCKRCRATYEVVFMDIDMPIMNGLETTQRILDYCDNNKLYKPIIIAQTAYVDADSQMKCYATGMSHFLAKPIQKKDLSNVLEYFGFY